MKKIISTFLILTMMLSSLSVTYGQAILYESSAVELDSKMIKSNFNNMSEEAKTIFLEEIKNDPVLMEYHIKYVDPNFKVDAVSQRSMGYSAMSMSAYSVAADASVLAELRSGLQALNLPSAVYYSLVSFGSSLAAAVADGPLPVGDIAAIGTGLVTGLAVAWYWDEIEGKIDDIIDVFSNTFSSISRNVEKALDEMFYKAQPKKPTGRKVRDVQKKLKKEGFEKQKNNGGSHEKWKKGDKTVTVPNHGGSYEIPTGTLRNIWKQAGWI